MTRTSSEPTEADFDQRRLAEADELGMQLVRFKRMMTRAAANMAKQHTDGLESTSYAILGMLGHLGPQRTTALAEELHSEISTVSRQISALVELGLVERQADPHDGRACLLAVTDAGYDTFRRAKQQRSAWIAGMLDDWDDADRAELNRLFTKLNDAMEEHAPELAKTALRTNKGEF